MCSQEAIESHVIYGDFHLSQPKKHILYFMFVFTYFFFSSLLICMKIFSLPRQPKSDPCTSPLIILKCWKHDTDFAISPHRHRHHQFVTALCAQVLSVPISLVLSHPPLRVPHACPFWLTAQPWHTGSSNPACQWKDPLSSMYSSHYLLTFLSLTMKDNVCLKAERDICDATRMTGLADSLNLHVCYLYGILFLFGFEGD